MGLLVLGVSVSYSVTVNNQCTDGHELEFSIVSEEMYKVYCNIETAVDSERSLGRLVNPDNSPVMTDGFLQMIGAIEILLYLSGKYIYVAKILDIFLDPDSYLI